MSCFNYFVFILFLSLIVCLCLFYFHFLFYFIIGPKAQGHICPALFGPFSSFYRPNLASNLAQIATQAKLQLGPACKAQSCKITQLDMAQTKQARLGFNSRAHHYRTMAKQSCPVGLRWFSLSQPGLRSAFSRATKAPSSHRLGSCFLRLGTSQAITPHAHRHEATLCTAVTVFSPARDFISHYTQPRSFSRHACACMRTPPRPSSLEHAQAGPHA